VVELKLLVFSLLLTLLILILLDFIFLQGVLLNCSSKKISGASTRLPKVLVGTYSRHDNPWDPKSYDLKLGNNVITDSTAFGGLIWIRFGTTTGPDGVYRITFGAGNYITAPVYIKDITTDAQWDAQLTATSSPDALLLGDRVVGVITLARAKAYKSQDNSHVLQVLDQIVTAEDVLSGLDGSAPQHQINQNRMLITETDRTGVSYWMMATYYRITVLAESAPNAFQVAGLDSAPWGIAHEIGHMHQQSPWTWGGLSETTVNIYTLASQRSFGVTSRLITDGLYPKAFTFIASTDPAKNFNSQDVWIKLVMFQQLQLAYGDSFYIQLHQQTRVSPPGLTTDADKQRYFMLKACTISGENLTTFFRKWGFVVAQSVYDEIAALPNLKPPTVEPSTRCEP